MIHIVNGKNRFKKETEIKNIIDKLRPFYSIGEARIEKRDKSEIIYEKLEDIFINISRNDDSNFCGLVLLPNMKKNDDTFKLTKDILNSISHKCGEDKQLIIYSPVDFTNKQKEEISLACNNRSHNFIDLEYITSKKEIISFIEDTLCEFNIQFESEELKEETIEILLSSFHFILDNNKELKRPTIFSSDSKKVYDQFFIYTTLRSFHLFSIGKENKKITSNEIKSMITSLNLKKPAISILKQIFECNDHKSIIETFNLIFDNLERADIPLFLGFLKNSLFEYLKFCSDNTATKRSKVIETGNLKLSNPQKLYFDICQLSNNKLLNYQSYQNDLILFFLEQLHNDTLY